MRKFLPSSQLWEEFWLFHASSNYYYNSNYGGHCASVQQEVFVAFPRFVPRHNPVSELYKQIL